MREASLIWADLQEADLRGALLDKTDLRGADLSRASLGGASTFERTRSHLRRRGALFREKTNVIVAECFSEKVGRDALGFGLGGKSFHSMGGICTIVWVLFTLVLFFHISLEALTKPKQGVSSRKGCVHSRPHNGIDSAHGMK